MNALPPLQDALPPVWAAESLRQKEADDSAADFGETLRRQMNERRDAEQDDERQKRLESKPDAPRRAAHSSDREDTAETGRKKRPSQDTAGNEKRDPQQEPPPVALWAALGLERNDGRLPSAASSSEDAAPQATEESASYSVAESAGVLAAGTIKAPAHAANGELAIAMRISRGTEAEADAVGPSSDTSKPDASVGLAANVAAAAHAGQSSSGGDSSASNGDGAGAHDPQQSQQQHKGGEQAGGTTNLIAPVADNTPEIAKGSNVHETQPAQATGRSEFEAELQKLASEPVRGAHVQISGGDAAPVNIRMIEREGTLSVTVRSPDAVLSRSLQEHTADLNTRLASEQYRTEIWKPDFQKDAPDSRSYGDNAGGNSQQRQSGRDRKRPAWLNKIENTKLSQNRIELTWPQ